MIKTNSKTGWNLDNSYARLPDTFFVHQNPTPVRSPALVIFNAPLAATLGLSVEALQSDDGIAIFAGNQLPKGSDPLAQAYAGHQFGHFTMLGDGRAILLGEQLTPKGERFDIQLKGSGRTPFSRGGDGRAALGPMLREYIISEAMHALGIPTTRGLAVVTTGEFVQRETSLPGAILTRVAASHLRVGTFQYVAKWGTLEELRILADYALQRHFPNTEGVENPYFYLLQEVIKRQAALIAKWQMVGFIHGVMNTDNMALSGETIDFGPCAFMDTYDSATVFSSIDIRGRYAYGNQLDIAGWNLTRFAETLLPLLHADREQAIILAQAALAKFADLYHTNWLTGMSAKLGLLTVEAEDELLIARLLHLMQVHQADYINTFRALTLETHDATALFSSEDFSRWTEKWQARLGRQQASKASAMQVMKHCNPSIIPRNHRVEEALAAAVEKGDYSVMEQLLHLLSNPFAYTSEQEEYAKLPDTATTPYRTFCGT